MKAARVLGFATPSDFVRAYPVSREWLTLLIRRMDAVAAVLQPVSALIFSVDRSLPESSEGRNYVTILLRSAMSCAMHSRRKSRKAVTFSIVPTGSDHSKYSGYHAECPSTFSTNGGGASLQMLPYNSYALRNRSARSDPAESVGLRKCEGT